MATFQNPSDVASDDLTTWSMGELRKELAAEKRDAAKGFGDPDNRRRIKAEMDRRKAGKR